mgnify:CR=1 FL=1
MKNKLYFEEFGEQLLKVKGISKAEFARRLGIHKQNVNSVFSTKSVIVLRKNAVTPERIGISQRRPNSLKLGVVARFMPRKLKSTFMSFSDTCATASKFWLTRPAIWISAVYAFSLTTPRSSPSFVTSSAESPIKYVRGLEIT